MILWFAERDKFLNYEKTTSRYMQNVSQEKKEIVMNLYIWHRRGIHCNATGLRDPFGNKHSKGIKCIQRHRNRGRKVK